MTYEPVTRFGITDYVVFSLILLMTITVGVYFSFRHGKSRTLVEYFVGNRQMGLVPVALSLIATFQSIIGLIGTTTEVYLFGAGAWYQYCSFALVVPIVAYCYLPVFYNLKLTSVFEYLERRFNSTLRKIGSFISVVYLAILTSIILYGSSLVLMQVTGLHFWISVIISGIIATFYTALGGIRAVMWTDVVQVIIICISVLTCTVQGSNNLGGVHYVITEAWKDGLMTVSTELDLRVRYTVWNVIFPTMLTGIAMSGIGQMYVQRFASAPTLKKARRSLYIYTMCNLFFSFWLLLASAIIYVKYRNCDPLMTGKVNKADQIIALFMMETLHKYPGLCGLFISGLFCAALSTISSSLNSISAMVFEDFLKTLDIFNLMSSSRATTVSKLITAVFGLIAIIFVSVLENVDTIYGAFVYNSNVFSGINVGLFSLGLFIPWANSFGATMGVVLGTVIAQWISIASQMHPPYTKRPLGSVTGCNIEETFSFNFTNNVSSTVDQMQSDIFPLYQVAFSWIIFFSTAPVIIFGMIFSAIYRPPNTKVLDARLIAPIIRRFLASPIDNQLDDEVVKFEIQENGPENSKPKERAGEVTEHFTC